VVYDVPLVMAGGIVDKVKNTGTVRVREVAPNPQAPEGKLALARIEVTFTNGDVLVPRDDGLMVQVRNGLSSSLQGLFWSVKVLIIGLLCVLPWLLLIYAMVWLTRRMWRPTVLAPAGVVATEAPAGLGGLPVFQPLARAARVRCRTGLSAPAGPLSQYMLLARKPFRRGGAML
jgi:hypothetical protein